MALLVDVMLVLFIIFIIYLRRKGGTLQICGPGCGAGTLGCLHKIGFVTETKVLRIKPSRRCYRV
jgi:hypothetical protein